MPRFSYLGGQDQPVPKYRHHRASGQAIVTLSGHDYYLGVFGSRASKIEYDRLVAEWLEGGRYLPRAGNGDVTVVELCAAFWRFAKRYYVKNKRPTSTLGNVKRAIDLLRPLYGRISVSEFRPKCLKTLRHKLLESDRMNRGTINQHIAIMKQLFEWGVAEELVSPVVYQALAAVKNLRKGRTTAREPAPVKSVSVEIVEATLPHLPPIVADMVRFQRLTGARPGELCQLRPTDVDRSKSTWEYRPESHKTQHHDRDRIIFIGPKAQQVLRPYLLRAADAYCFSPAEAVKQHLEARRTARKTPLTYGNSPGTNRKSQPKRNPQDRYTKDAYNRAIQRACEMTFDMPKELRRISKKLAADERKRLQKLAAEWRAKHCWSPNQLRHAAGTDVRRQFGLEAAQVVLGHAKADVTQVYAERDQALAAEIMRKIG